MGNTAAPFSITVDTVIHSDLASVWKFLVDPVKLGEAFWGSTVESDFTIGGPIVWKGAWQGKPFEDRGTVKRVEPLALLQYTHWTVATAGTLESSPNLLTYRLSSEKDGVRVTFTHENIPTEEARGHSEPQWRQLLERMKGMLEARP
jgi:uncharacterized protein YndB with AHSA1/START domain